MEFIEQSGRVCFVPFCQDVTGERLGSAIARIVEAHFDGTNEIDAPAWISQISVPGADVYNGKIDELKARGELIAAEISTLEEKRSAVTNYRSLLFGYGRSVLEPVVRAAFKLFGFEVPEPETYAGEWDVEVRDLTSGKTAIGEVEGSEGLIDVDKYRQVARLRTR